MNPLCSAVGFLQADMPAPAMNIISNIYQDYPESKFIQYLSSSGFIRNHPAYSHGKWLDLYTHLSHIDEAILPRDPWMQSLGLVDLFKSISYYRKEQLSFSISDETLADHSNTLVMAAGIHKIFNPGIFPSNIIKPLNYLPKYIEIARHMRRLKKPKQQRLKILEIGTFFGGSALLLSALFDANVVSVDINNHAHSNVALGENRNVVYDSCDQSSAESLNCVLDRYGKDFDIIIDDGSHMTAHQIITLNTLVPVTNPLVYIVEDTWYQHSSQYNPQGLSLFSEAVSKYTDDKLGCMSTGRFCGSPYEVNMQHGLLVLSRLASASTDFYGILR